MGDKLRLMEAPKAYDISRLPLLPCHGAEVYLDTSTNAFVLSYYPTFITDINIEWALRWRIIY